MGRVSADANRLRRGACLERICAARFNSNGSQALVEKLLPQVLRAPVTKDHTMILPRQTMSTRSQLGRRDQGPSSISSHCASVTSKNSASQLRGATSVTRMRRPLEEGSLSEVGRSADVGPVHRNATLYVSIQSSLVDPRSADPICCALFATHNRDHKKVKVRSIYRRVVRGRSASISPRLPASPRTLLATLACTPRSSLRLHLFFNVRRGGAAMAD